MQKQKFAVVVVTKSGNTWTIRFTGNLTNTDVSLMQGDAKLSANGTLLQTMTFGYDTAARMTSASDPAATYAYTFDKLDRITGETQTIAGLTPKIQLDRTFSALGSVLTLAADFVQNNQVVADDFINTYSYDGLNRMISLVQDNQTGGSANAVADKRVELKYNALGQFTSIERNQNTSATYPSLRTAFTYDTGNRLSSIAHRNYTDASTSTLLSDYAFSYDNISRITAVNSSIDGNSAIAYDKTHQVTAADHAAGRTDESYSYDANGNRTNSGYTTTTNNRTTSDGTYNYLYDKEGNRTRRTLIADGSYEQYTWDHRNRLTKVEFKTSAGTLTKSVIYSYDVFNRLVRRQLDPDGSGSQPATNIFYAGYDGITPTLEFDGTTKDDVSHRYLWGAAFDQLFADEQVTVPTSNGNVLWPLADHLGTIRDIADYNESSPAFTITNHRVYDTFGRLESETNSSVDLSFGYTGKQFDDATSLNNYLNRWYDPRIGKWLGEDPIGFSAGDANLSRYVGNTATMLTDPLGLAAFDADGAALTTSNSELQDFGGGSSSGSGASGSRGQDEDAEITKTRKVISPPIGNEAYNEALEVYLSIDKLGDVIVYSIPGPKWNETYHFKKTLDGTFTRDPDSPHLRDDDSVQVLWIFRDKNGDIIDNGTNDDNNDGTPDWTVGAKLNPHGRRYRPKGTKTNEDQEGVYWKLKIPAGTTDVEILIVGTDVVWGPDVKGTRTGVGGVDEPFESIYDTPAIVCAWRRTRPDPGKPWDTRIDDTIITKREKDQGKVVNRKVRDETFEILGVRNFEWTHRDPNPKTPGDVNSGYFFKKR